MLRLATVLVAGALSMAACGGDDEPTATATSSPAPATATPTSTATAEGIDPLKGASTEAVVVPPTNRHVALLSDVRAARHEGYDRVVFEFEKTLPGYDVRYVERPVRQDGSGKVVKIDGAHVVEVRMENSLDADLSKPSAPMTYDGPMRLSPATPEVAELARTGGFEGVLTWVVGLRDRVDFRVTTVNNPPRLVVDFRNH